MHHPPVEESTTWILEHKHCQKLWQHEKTHFLAHLLHHDQRYVYLFHFIIDRVFFHPLSLDVSSIRCYECNTHEQRRECGDPFNHLGVGVKECSDLNTDPVHMCYKSSHYSEYNWYFLLMYAVPMYICFRWWKIPYCSRLCSFRYKLFYTSMASGNGWILLERIQ